MTDLCSKTAYSELTFKFASVLFVEEAPVQSLTHPPTHSRYFDSSIGPNGEMTMLIIAILR